MNDVDSILTQPWEDYTFTSFHIYHTNAYNPYVESKIICMVISSKCRINMDDGYIMIYLCSKY